MKEPYIEPDNVELHYTSPEMVRDLVTLIPKEEGDVFLDAGSGRNKVWHQAVGGHECELSEGNDFYEWDIEVDWVVGNPPYNESWRFTEKALTVSRKGIAWLLNNAALNSHLTPARLQKLHDLGWHYTKMHVVADKRWFGRYYFLVLERKKGDFIGWTKQTY